MKLSTKCRYGLRALVDLAVYSESGHVALHEIAARQDISLKYRYKKYKYLADLYFHLFKVYILLFYMKFEIYKPC